MMKNDITIFISFFRSKEDVEPYEVLRLANFVPGEVEPMIREFMSTCRDNQGKVVIEWKPIP